VREAARGSANIPVVETISENLQKSAETADERGWDRVVVRGSWFLEIAIFDFRFSIAIRNSQIANLFTCCICCIGFGPCENHNFRPTRDLEISTLQKCCAPRATVATPTFPAGDALEPQMDSDERGSDSAFSLAASLLALYNGCNHL
jgi:hypothetical protein